MMSTRWLLIAPILLAMPLDADAQRYRRRAMAMYGAVPYAGVTVSPYRGYSVRSPYYSYSFGYPGVRSVPPSRGSAVYSWPGGSVTVNRPVITPSEPTYLPQGAGVAQPTRAPELGPAPAFAPTDAPPSAPQESLIGDLTGALDKLYEKLDLFNGGDGWQRYLAMDEQSIRDPAAQQRLLKRMESVAREARFNQVSQLDEFQKVYDLLQVMASVEAGKASKPTVPAPPFEQDNGGGAFETIPPPEQDQPADAATTERSVLRGREI